MGLPISPGIDGIPTTTIPDDPSQFVAWFKSVGIKRWLANADVRNAIGSYPINVAGTIATNGQLSLSAEATALIQAIEQIANKTVVGNVSGSTGTPQALTQAQLTALVNVFTATLAGTVPASGGGTTNFLRADGTWDSVTATVTTADSIQGAGSVASPIELVNDSAAPGNSMVYGTNASGTKGWFAATSGSGTVTSITAGTGLTGGTISTSGTIAQSLTWSPTQTGNWVFTPGSGIGLTANGIANNDALYVKGNSTTSQSYGIAIQAGTNASDAPEFVESYGGTLLRETLGDGSMTGGSPTGGGKGLGTWNVSGGYYVNGVAISSSQFNKGAGWNSTSSAIVLSLVTPIDVIIPYACTLQEVDIITQGGAGSCTVSVWKAASLAAPTSANDITGGTSPAISSGTGYANTTLSGWTTAFAQNDRVRFTLAANTNFTTVEIILRLK